MEIRNVRDKISRQLLIQTQWISATCNSTSSEKQKTSSGPPLQEKEEVPRPSRNQPWIKSCTIVEIPLHILYTYSFSSTSNFSTFFFFPLIFPLTLKNLNLISFSKESEINSNYPSSCIPLPNQKTPTPISEACYRQHPFLKISVKFRCELMMPVISCMAAGTN